MLSEDEKAIQFYKRFIETEEQELEWMYKEDEEYYRDSIEQKELLIKGWRNILNLITKLQKENEHWKNGFEKELEDNRKNTCELLKKDLIIREKDKQIDLTAEQLAGLTIWNNNKEEPLILTDKEEVKQYFEKLAKEKGEI